jgi:hypothetical protein
MAQAQQAQQGFCGAHSATPASLTTQDLQSPFQNSILPSSVIRNPDGTLSDASLKAHITSLQSAGTLPVRPDIKTLQGGAPTNDPASPLALYVQKERTMLDSIKAEYCYYEGRYRYALNRLLDAVAQSSLPATNNTSQQGSFEVYLPITKSLNQKLNDLTQVSNAIAKARYSLSRTDNEQIQSMNNAIAARSETLKEHATILKSDTSAADLRKRMVEYSNEKNNATNNLLTLYAVLNIVAIGVLVSLARSA